VSLIALGQLLVGWQKVHPKCDKKGLLDAQDWHMGWKEQQEAVEWVVA